MAGNGASEKCVLKSFKIMLVFRLDIIRRWSKSHCALKYRSRILKDLSTSKKLVIYGDEASPPVRAVMVTATLLGLDFDLHKIDLFKGEHKTECYKKINPLQKVPAVSIDGEIICDSHAILLYLCRRAGHQDLYPSAIMSKAKVDQMLYFNATTMFPIDSAIFSNYFAGKWPVDEGKVVQWYSAVDYLEFHLHKHKWLAGDQMQICDICCATTLCSLGIILPPLKHHVKVKEWVVNLHNIPSFEINRRGLKRLKYFVEKYGPATVDESP